MRRKLLSVWGWMQTQKLPFMVLQSLDSDAVDFYFPLDGIHAVKIIKATFGAHREQQLVCSQGNITQSAHS